MMGAIGRRWVVAFNSSVGVRRQGGSGENSVWQQQRRVVRAGTQQSINNPLQWMMSRQRGQREGECNNQIKVAYVRGLLAVDDTKRGGGGQCGQAGGEQCNKREGGDMRQVGGR
jgi:hypothetical protein